ncbi:MAG: N-acetylglucosamine-6-phosphate deacetylase, partial [Oscillospiraceae bacterium]
DIEKAVLAIGAAKAENADGAFIAGINLEGPFISHAKKGAQMGESIIAPDYAVFQKLFALSQNSIKLVDIAPEGEGALEFIKKAKDCCAVSIAHTTADFDLAKKSFAAGITHATHLFNAMTGMSHREPGVVGAVFDTDTVYAELVCDGHHIHPAVVRAAFRLLGDRLCVVSDAMRLCGMEENETGALGGQEVRVNGGKATLADGTIAGSITNLHHELLNLVAWGIPLPTAVKAMTLTPAKAIGLDDELGSIKAGKKADLVVLDKDLNIAAVYH